MHAVEVRTVDHQAPHPGAGGENQPVVFDRPGFGGDAALAPVYRRDPRREPDVEVRLVIKSFGLEQQALDGQLADVGTRVHPNFGLNVPETCPDIPPEVLDPKTTWADKGAYDQTARELTKRFEVNFKQYEPYVGDSVKAAGIHAGV